MSNSNDGGSAFPMPLGNEQVDPSCAGMSLRDYFAGKAVNGILAGVLADGSTLDADGLRSSAIAAYQVADAMISEREK